MQWNVVAKHNLSSFVKGESQCKSDQKIRIWSDYNVITYVRYCIQSILFSHIICGHNYTSVICYYYHASILYSTFFLLIITILKNVLHIRVRKVHLRLLPLVQPFSALCLPIHSITACYLFSYHVSSHSKSALFFIMLLDYFVGTLHHPNSTLHQRTQHSQPEQAQRLFHRVLCQDLLQTQMYHSWDLNQRQNLYVKYIMSFHIWICKGY